MRKKQCKRRFDPLIKFLLKSYKKIDLLIKIKMTLTIDKNIHISNVCM